MYLHLPIYRILSQAGVIMDGAPKGEPPNNVFSLSDKVLYERLQFIREVGVRPTPGAFLLSLTIYIHRLVAVTGEAFGYVDRNQQQPRTGA